MTSKSFKVTIAPVLFHLDRGCVIVDNPSIGSPFVATRGEVPRACLKNIRRMTLRTLLEERFVAPSAKTDGGEETYAITRRGKNALRKEAT